MAYLGNAPARSFISFERQVFTIVNSQTVYTLSHSVTNENDIRLVVNNVVQEPGSGKAYTASGTTLTLSAALVNGTDEMYCVFLGRAVGTVNAPAGSVDTAQLAADAVTNAKIADDAISDEQLDPTVITGQTAETSIATDDLILLSDTSASGALRKMTRANFVSGIGGTNTPAFMASITSDQTLSDNTLTKLAFSNEVIDTDNAYDPSTNYRFTPGVVGKYMIGLDGWIFNSPDLIQTIQLFIYKNGSDISYSHTANYNATFERLHISFNTIIDVGSTSDYYEAYVRQNTSNGSTSTFSGSGNNAKFRNSFCSYKLIT